MLKIPALFLNIIMVRAFSYPFMTHAPRPARARWPALSGKSSFPIRVRGQGWRALDYPAAGAGGVASIAEAAGIAGAAGAGGWRGGPEGPGG